MAKTFGCSLDCLGVPFHSQIVTMRSMWGDAAGAGAWGDAEGEAEALEAGGALTRVGAG